MKEVISVKELLIAIAIFVQSLLPDHLTSSNCLLYFYFVFFCPESHFEFQKCCCYETLLFAVDFKSRVSTISFLFLLLFLSLTALFFSHSTLHVLHFKSYCHNFIVVQGWSSWRSKCVCNWLSTRYLFSPDVLSRNFLRLNINLLQQDG